MCLYKLAPTLYQNIPRYLQDNYFIFYEKYQNIESQKLQLLTDARRFRDCRMYNLICFCIVTYCGENNDTR